MQALTAFVVALVDNPAVLSFYIGRTVAPRARASAHDCAVLLVLAAEKSTAGAMKIEGALLRALARNGKRRNVAAHAGGGVAHGHRAAAVYLALWGLPPRKKNSRAARNG